MDAGDELMNRDLAVAAIRRQLGFRTDLASDITSELQIAQAELEKGPTKPWFLVSEDSYKRTTVGEQRLELPSDFLEEVEDGVLRYVPDTPADNSDESNEVDLVKEDYDILRKNYLLNTGGPPEAYCLLGKYFRIFPTPNEAYLIRMIYFKKALTLDTNIENEWLEHVPLLLMGSAGLKIATALRDSGAASVNESRMHTNRSYQVGGPH